MRGDLIPIQHVADLDGSGGDAENGIGYSCLCASGYFGVQCEETSSPSSTPTGTPTTSEPTTSEPTPSPTPNPTPAPTLVPTAGPVEGQGCLDGELVIVPNDADRGPVCRSVNTSFVSRIVASVDFTVPSGIGFASNDAVMTSVNQTYEGSYTLLNGVTNAVYQVSSVPFGSTAANPVSQTAPSANDVTAILQTETIFWDQRDIRVAVQLRDTGSLETKTQPTTITIRATPETSTVTAEQVFSCGNRADGVCSFRLVASTQLFGSLADGERINIEYGVDGVFRSCGHVTSTARVDSGSISENIFVELPARSLQPGQTQRLTITSKYTAQLKTHRIQLRVGAGLTIDADSCSAIAPATSGWTGPCQLSNSNRQIDTAMSRNNPPGDSSGEEELLQLTVRANNDVVDGVRATVTLLSTELKDFDLFTIAAGVSGAVIDVADIHTDGTGSVGFVRDSLAGLFASMVGPSELFNTAVLSGDAITKQVIATTVTRLSNSVNSGSGASCSTTADASTVTVSPQCSVVLSGDESSGTDTATITMSLGGGLSAMLPIRVFSLARYCSSRSMRRCTQLAGCTTKMTAAA